MKGKKEKIKKMLDKHNTKKVHLCTGKVCISGHLDCENDIDEIVVIDNAEVTCKNGEKTHKDKICVFDEHIMAFEPVME